MGPRIAPGLTPRPFRVNTDDELRKLRESEHAIIATIERLRPRTRLFRGVSQRLFDRQAGHKFSPYDIVTANTMYPFDAIEVEFDDPPIASSPGSLSRYPVKIPRIIFAAIRRHPRADALMHQLYVAHQYVEIPFEVWSRREIIIDPENGEIRTDEDDNGGIVVPLQSSMFLWSGLISLCAALANCRSQIIAERVDPMTNEPYVNRQVRRDAERSGAWETYQIRLRPGITLHKALVAVSKARRDIVRSRPRRHIVDEYQRRQHTSKGVEMRTIARYWRGGRAGGERQSVYDASRL